MRKVVIEADTIKNIVLAALDFKGPDDTVVQAVIKHLQSRIGDGETLESLSADNLQSILDEIPSAIDHKAVQENEISSVINRAVDQESEYRELFDGSKGFFFGSKELRLNKEIPRIPYTIKDLTSPHPLHSDCKIMDVCALGFDEETNEWHLVEFNAMPGSTGSDGKGLSASEQDKLLNKLEMVGNMKAESPTYYEPARRIIQRVVDAQITSGVEDKKLALAMIKARTWDICERGGSRTIGTVFTPMPFVTYQVDSQPQKAFGSIGLLVAWRHVA